MGHMAADVALRQERKLRKRHSRCSVGAVAEGSDEQNERLRMLAVENRRRHHRPALLSEIEAATGTEPPLDDFLALTATERLREAVVDQAKYHQVSHRIWGDRLAGEVARTLVELADRLDEAEAYLLWRDPPEAVLVPVGAMLRHTSERLSAQSGLTLISGDAKSGLVLTWDHLSYADEYSLLTWGRFAFDLTQPL